MKIYEIENIANINYGTRVVKKRDSGTIYDVYGGGDKTFKVDSFNRENCVIVSRFGMSEECVRKVDGKFFLNDSGLSVETKNPNVVIQKYIDWFLFSKMFDIYLLGRGAAQKNLDVDKFRLIKIPVPSLQEQEKIIEKLDRSFNYISTQIENIKTQINLNSLIFESYFENVQSNFMNSGTISEFFDLATGGTPSKKNKDYFNNGNIPWLLSGDVHQENILESKNFITEDALKNSNAKYLPIGSVLIALNGQGKTRGTVAQLKINATCNQSLVSINSKDNNVIENEFLFYFLKSQYKKIRKLTGDSGNDRRGLNMKIINSMQIKFPEISVQKKIVDNCISLTEINKNLTKILDSKMNKYAELKNSLLSKELSYE
ncbi:MAG: restriction endonuclease subunit S [Candidatus Actinomarinaceae bacterium]